MAQFTVNQAETTVYSAFIGSVRHPEKGRILFALCDIDADAEIAAEPLTSIITKYFDDVHVFRQALEEVGDKNEYLQHCCPCGSGQICEQSTEHFNAFFSHSDSPSCSQNCDRFTTHVVRITANRAIAKGEELTVSYDESVGYEKHGDEPVMRDFLALCAEHGVVKRPSQLTMPPVVVVVQ